MSDQLRIQPITLADAEAVSELFSAQPDAYLQYFHPFDFAFSSVEQILRGVQEDIYMGIFWGARLIGLFFLRGWDAGYAIPAYGVLIDHGFQGQGFGAVTLSIAKTICRLRGTKRLMLKVHPANANAKHLYEAAGFQPSGVDPKNNNLIYYFDFT